MLELRHEVAHNPCSAPQSSTAQVAACNFADYAQFRSCETTYRPGNTEFTTLGASTYSLQASVNLVHFICVVL